MGKAQSLPNDAYLATVNFDTRESNSCNRQQQNGGAYGYVLCVMKTLLLHHSILLILYFGRKLPLEWWSRAHACVRASLRMDARHYTSHDAALYSTVHYSAQRYTTLHGATLLNSTLNGTARINSTLHDAIDYCTEDTFLKGFDSSTISSRLAFGSCCINISSACLKRSVAGLYIKCCIQFTMWMF